MDEVFKAYQNNEPPPSMIEKHGILSKMRANDLLTDTCAAVAQFLGGRSMSKVTLEGVTARR